MKRRDVKHAQRFEFLTLAVLEQHALAEFADAWEIVLVRGNVTETNPNPRAST